MREIIYDGVSLDEDIVEDLIEPYAKHTPFTVIYDRFLGKITDDMYLELTPEETLDDLQNLLIDAIPGFEFPRQVLDDFVIVSVEIPRAQVAPRDFVIGVADEIQDTVLVERSYFKAQLTREEINILAILMLEGWVQRQLTSVEVTRMKYSGPDFKMTSQANHLQKLLNLLTEVKRQSLHMQRLYKRRKVDANGRITSNWSIFSSRFDNESNN